MDNKPFIAKLSFYSGMKDEMTTKVCPECGKKRGFVEVTYPLPDMVNEVCPGCIEKERVRKKHHEHTTRRARGECRDDCFECHKIDTAPSSDPGPGLQWKYHIFEAGSRRGPGEWRVHQTGWPETEL